MHTPRQNLFTRDDTFFGICEGLGEDLRIPPNLLRLALTLALFFHPLAALGTYLAAGLVVLLSRLLVPNPRARQAPAVEAEPQQEAAIEPAAAGVAPEPVPLAA